MKLDTFTPKLAKEENLALVIIISLVILVCALTSMNECHPSHQYVEKIKANSNDKIELAGYQKSAISSNPLHEIASSEHLITGKRLSCAINSFKFNSKNQKALNLLN